MDYQKYVQMLKAMAIKSLKIIDLLSCGSLCACDILEHFDFSAYPFPPYESFAKCWYCCGTQGR